MLVNLSTEIINEIFSFLTIQECENIYETVDNNEIKTLLSSNIYGRTMLYLNNKENSLTGGNKMTQMMFKYMDIDGLSKVIGNRENNAARTVANNDNNDPGINRGNNDNINDNDDNNCIIPKRFVLSYSYNRSNYNDNQDDPFLNEFNDFLPSGSSYFNKIGNVEISVDLFNKKFDSNEVDCISNIINSDCFNDNLTYLNLNRFHRLPEQCCSMLTQVLESNLHKFSYLHTLSLSSNLISSLDKVSFPESILFLNLDNNKLTELPANLPPNLIKLNISCNYLQDLSGAKFPDSLQYLDIQLNEIKKLNIKFPPNLKVLIACGNNIIFDDDEIIKFPEDLCYLNLLQNPYLNNLKTLDINRSLKTIYVDAAYQHKTNNNAITFI